MKAEQLRAAALKRWAWRTETRYQIINTDIDGLLAAAKLHDHFGWPVIGFNDLTTIWVEETHQGRTPKSQVAWVDLAMCRPGDRCIDQHVVARTAQEASVIEAHGHSVNPNLIAGRYQNDLYKEKYPFGTYQWVSWLLGEDERRGDPAIDRIGAGLAWMPDGPSISMGKYKTNVLNWACELMPGSILHPGARLADTPSFTPRAWVAEAKQYLTRASGVCTNWGESDQWSQPPGEQVPRRDDMQALLDAITRHYGWKRLTLPSRYVATRGSRDWDGVPPGWPQSAGASGVISAAAITGKKWSWTTAVDTRARS
ncbi:hypothetical protein [Serinibacter salmoneus]|uniref:Uncharacterized protein n=1 Tax=Serinibacter salmoneus TaxID=556530 RepID=A0A2A9D349_9MICO|nr:hypothetical protein [Serinibacter salmoneus]PFG21127.1 hypothetical protein ATL40_2748 [Serinibacter salmoneus]